MCATGCRWISFEKVIKRWLPGDSRQNPVKSDFMNVLWLRRLKFCFSRKKYFIPCSAHAQLVSGSLIYNFLFQNEWYVRRKSLVRRVSPVWQAVLPVISHVTRDSSAGRKLRSSAVRFPSRYCRWYLYDSRLTTYHFVTHTWPAIRFYQYFVIASFMKWRYPSDDVIHEMTWFTRWRCQ